MKLRVRPSSIALLAVLSVFGGYIKYQANVAALPPELARTEYSYSDQRAVTSGLAATDPDHPPVDLHCPPPGTVFTLSTTGSDGQPVSWKSVGPKGWDCSIQSSNAGEHGLWGADATNPLRLMWPLSVGKTAATAVVMADGSTQASAWRVTGYQPYRLQLGTVDAFSVQQEITEGKTLHYMVTHYWSPALGVRIAQRKRAIRGDLPSHLAPDWEVVAIRDAHDAPTARGLMISKQSAGEDIRFALARAEAVHPNLYWYVDRARVQKRQNAVIAALSDPASAMDVYLALSETLGLLGDGHVSLSRPAGDNGDVLTTFTKSGGTLLSVVVRPVADGVKVIWSRTPGLRVGDMLTTINGQQATALFDRVMALQPGEPRYKRYLAQLLFSDGLWDIGVQAPFVLQGTFTGVPGRIRLAGAARDNTAPVRPDDEGIRLIPLPDQVFLIQFDRMTAPRARFQTRLEAIFTEVAQQHAVGLIIDLRRNGGGNTRLGDDLLSYISGKPRRPFARKDVQASPECSAYFGVDFMDNRSKVPADDLPYAKSMSWEVPVTTPPANPLRFQGPVAVLIGPGTFSAANILANTISDFGLATLIGSDTAEISNNFGMACPVRLPHTGIELEVPSTYLVRANGDAASREDVHPDISVPLPDDDGLSADVDIVAARRWLRSQPNPARRQDQAAITP